MAIPLAAKLAALGGAGTALVMDNKEEREKIKKMLENDRPGKKMGEAAVKGYIAEAMKSEAPDAETRKRISEEAAQAGREAEDEVKRERRGVIKKAKGGSVKSSASKRADGCAVRGKTRGKMV